MTLYLIGSAVAAVIILFALRYPFWRRRKEGLLVLTYHHIGTPPKNSKLKRNWVSAENFSKQINFLLAKGYTPITFDVLRKIQNGKTAMPQKPVMITFDDGFKDILAAAEILKKKKIKANLFAVYDALGHHNFWHDPKTEVWQDMLSKEELLELQHTKIFEIASHTLTHANLPKLTPELAKHEIEESKHRLEVLTAKPCYAIALPYGAGEGNAQINQFINDAGYTFVFGSKAGINTFPLSSGAVLKRYTVRRGTNLLDFRLF